MNKNKKMFFSFATLLASALAFSTLNVSGAKKNLAEGETKGDLAVAVQGYLDGKDKTALSERDVDGLAVVKSLAVKKGEEVFDATGYEDGLNAAKKVIDDSPMFASLKEVGRPFTTKDLRADRTVSGAAGAGDSTNNTSGDLSVLAEDNYSMGAAFFFKNTEVIDGEDGHVILRTSDGSNGYKFSFDYKTEGSDTVTFSVSGTNLYTVDVDLDPTKSALIEMYAVDYSDGSGVCTYMYLDGEFIGYASTETVVNNKKINHLAHKMVNAEPDCCEFACAYPDDLRVFTVKPVSLTGGHSGSDQFTILTAEDFDVPVGLSGADDGKNQECFRALDDDTVSINGSNATKELHRGRHTFFKSDAKTLVTDSVHNLLNDSGNAEGVGDEGFVTLAGRSYRSDDTNHITYVMDFEDTTFLYDGEKYITVGDILSTYVEDMLDTTGLSEADVANLLSFARILGNENPKFNSQQDLTGLVEQINTLAAIFANLAECAPAKTMAELRSPRVISAAVGSSDSTNNAGSIAKVSDTNYSQHVRVDYFNGGVHNYSNFGNFDARYVLRSNDNGSQGYSFTFKNTSDEKATICIQVNNVTVASAEISMPVGVVHLVDMFAVNTSDNSKVLCYICVDGVMVACHLTDTVVNNESARHQINSTDGKWCGFGTHFENETNLGEIAFTKTAVAANDGTTNNVFFLEALEANDLPLTEGTSVSEGDPSNVMANASANLKVNGNVVDYNYTRSGGSINKVGDKLYRVALDRFNGSNINIAIGDTVELSGSYIYSDFRNSNKSYTFSIPTLVFKYVAENTWERVIPLSELVDDAKAEIAAYRADEIASYPSLSEAATQGIALANTALDSAADAAAIAVIVTTYKANVDDALVAAAAQAALNAKKQAAMTTIDNYLDKSNYRTYEQGVIDQIVNAGKDAISACASEDAINSAVVSVKAQLDEVKTKAQYEAEEALAAAKSTAKAALDGYAKADDYDDEGKAALTKAVSDGKAAIDAAADTAGVDSALANAKSVIDAIAKKAPAPADDKPAIKGCGGSILAGSAVVTLVSVLGACLLASKKKED